MSNIPYWRVLMKLRLSRIAPLLILGILVFPAFAVPQAASESVKKNYTEKTLEYTTEKFFLTELVDHLPASETVPSPFKILGHIVGAPDVLDHSAEIYKYMRALDAASSRVEVFSVGPTDEGREMIAVAVSSEENMARLHRIQVILGSLADPPGPQESGAARVIAEGLPD